MTDAPLETVSIAQAAALLGVHRNTIRNRIKAGRYKAHKVIAPQGETYVIDRASLGLSPDSSEGTRSQSQGRHKPSNPSQSDTLVDASQQAEQLAVVQRLLAPFVEELGRTREELGRTAERLRVTEEERDQLRVEIGRLTAGEKAATERSAVTGEAERQNMRHTAPRPWWRFWERFEW
jgi:excisionase family DNA binding protein